MAKLLAVCAVVFLTCGPAVDAQEDNPAAFFRADRERYAAPRRPVQGTVVQRPTRMIRRAAPVRGYARVVPESGANQREPRRDAVRAPQAAPETPREDAHAPPTPPAQENVTPDPMIADAAPTPALPPPPLPVRQGAPAFSIAILGDSLGMMLGQGLAEAFADKSEVTVLRRARENTGLVRDDYFDWVKTAREIANGSDKPSLAVIMVGSNDRQVLRESGSSVELRSPRWRQIYGDRVEAISKVFADKKIPLLWVGLPIMKNDRFSADMAAFNEIYKERAAGSGATFIDAWEPFLDDRGLYAAYGPDVNGQFQKLRAGDGVHFTKAGARKLAYFLESEVRRAMEGARPKVEQEIAALAPSRAPVEPPPTSVPLPPARGSAEPLIVVPLPPEVRVVIPVKPAEGAVVALTAPALSPGGQLVARARPPAATSEAQQLIDRVFSQGRPLDARAGRADDFSWPRR